MEAGVPGRQHNSLRPWRRNVTEMGDYTEEYFFEMHIGGDEQLRIVDFECSTFSLARAAKSCLHSDLPEHGIARCFEEPRPSRPRTRSAGLRSRMSLFPRRRPRDSYGAVSPRCSFTSLQAVNAEGATWWASSINPRLVPTTRISSPAETVSSGTGNGIAPTASTRAWQRSSRVPTSDSFSTLRSTICRTSVPMGSTASGFRPKMAATKAGAASAETLRER